MTAASKQIETSQHPAPAFPSLVEGNSYLLELIDDEAVRRATLVKFVEQPCGLGWGATFQFGKKRRFVYLRDIHSVVGNRIVAG
jgi:hypothetical protein